MLNTIHPIFLFPSLTNLGPVDHRTLSIEIYLFIYNPVAMATGSHKQNSYTDKVLLAHNIYSLLSSSYH